MSPSIRREWIEMRSRNDIRKLYQSPSIRREWIEMFMGIIKAIPQIVSLHTEGVD